MDNLEKLLSLEIRTHMPYTGQDLESYTAIIASYKRH